MPNVFKSGNTLTNGCIYKGQFTIGVNPNVEYGPTNITSFYNGITPSSGGYTIYVNKASQGPSIRTPANDSECISILLGLGSTGSTISNVLDWASQQPDIMVSNIDYPGIVTSGMVLNLDAGFVSSYPTQGVSWRDLSGNGNNGDLVNGPTFNSANGGSIVFDGSDDGVNINSFSNTNVTTEAFVWLNNNQNTKIFVSNYTQISSPTGFGIGISDFNDNIAKWFTGNLGTTNTLYSTTTLNNQQYYHVVGTYDGTNKVLYINGVAESSVVISNIINNTSTLGSVGYLRYLNNQQFNGRIGVARIYDRALSASEVLQNYNAQKSRFGL